MSGARTDPSRPAARTGSPHGEDLTEVAHDGQRAAEYWKTIVGPYKGADTRRSVYQVLSSAIPFFALWGLMLWSLRLPYVVTVLLAVPTAGFLMRLFMIQHDCGHGSFFRSRWARDAVGFCIGVLTLTPYQYWRKTHAHHHAHSGDLDLRGFGDIETLTVREYMKLPWYRRLGYRMYRNPIVLLGIGPAFLFLIKHRYPWDVPRSWSQAWASVWWTNLSLVAICTVAAFTIGLKAFLLVQVPITMISSGIGVWLFYVQHQFEETYWHRHEDWDYFEAAVHGSSHLVLPRPLEWITASIGLHHVHHLSSLIPNYRLRECLEANPELQKATRITVAEGWRLLRLALWDEERRRLIRFSDLRQLRGAAA